ncbi:hypothetical protein ACCS79_03710 [Rhizobium johnstonii]|uniref:hypothetical protein n=1 Tax=Rhizobium johnstonii TaxID=3019933 RepID=UPI003F981DA3
MTRKPQSSALTIKEPRSEAPVVSETPVDYIRGLGDFVTLTPIRSYEDQQFKDELRGVFAGLFADIEAEIEAGLAAGLTLEEINGLRAVELNLMPETKVVNGRRRVRWQYSIVDRSE